MLTKIGTKLNKNS